jgi:hypothetical protein
MYIYLMKALWRIYPLLSGDCKQQQLLCNRAINKHPFLCNGQGIVGL